MKRTTHMASVALAAMLAFVNCKGAGFSPPDNIKETFDAMYPAAKWVSWNIVNSYHVAEFTLDAVRSEAWFDTRGQWSMTESDIAFEQLPVVVRNDFDAGEFANWEIDDIDKLERQGMEDLYIIEVERGDQEMDIHYLANGTQVKTVIHDGPNTPPADLPEEVKAFLQKKYPAANIIEIEDDRGLLNIGILDDATRKEVVFNHRNNWVVTNWEVYTPDVPSAVTATLRASAYAQYQIEDIEYEEQADGTNVYIFELELGHQEIILHIDAESAKIISAIQDN